ncbi:NAD-dependent epimerase/dehydratase family protein [Mucilaginibacter myungsuensis]|uniref:NAD(P)H-binding protein n=1 Tax=Mucilaginibacter myungsuensis TaxID=649104 RepID=A0A929L4X7_9SPHI|nr:NAD-dependent epimerase/dehydratase family protein [Mucilaginibacter myungsuensis]MBE9663301.1 NAD(P)H-binding protein [Mucilaginibacter myungsuensis]MDN3600036.1 NAD(P)H-binding protein [Mucilaginibacter myungsuensis]
MKKLKVIITGATGMVGEGVLQECLLRDEVAEVLIVNRKPSGFSHPKLKEIIHADFFDISPIEKQLTGYDACYFCLGISSVGVDADTYYRMTYTLTMHVAETLAKRNPEMTFCYVSGAGTDSTEQGKTRWARVKGKTENDIAKLPFKQVFNFRPGVMTPTKGAKNVNKLYWWLSWMVPIIKVLFPNSISTLQQVADAMIQVTLHGYQSTIIEVKDIHAITIRK